MKLLVDQKISRRIVALLKVEGHDALHTEDVELATTVDPLILSRCCTQGCMLITADKKLTKFLASSSADCPSVLITREARTLSVEQTAAMLVSNLPQIERLVTEHGTPSSRLLLLNRFA